MIGSNEQVALDRHAGHRAMENLLEIKFAVSILINRGVLPDQARVWIANRLLTHFREHGLQAAMVNRSPLGIDGEFRADVAFPLGIDADQATVPFASARVTP